MPPPWPYALSCIDSPSRSSSRESVFDALPPFVLMLGVDDGSSPPKSMSDNSLSAFLLTPVDVPKVPFGIFEAASISPCLINLYLSIVRWILSLISRSLLTASASSDSSSHIFWILGCALCKALARSCVFISCSTHCSRLSKYTSKTSPSAMVSPSLKFCNRSSSSLAFCCTLETSSAAFAR